LSQAVHAASADLDARSIDDRLLNWLRCPECQGRLALVDSETLRCGGCHRNVHVRDGIPDFTEAPTATARSFGYMWGEQASRAEPPTAGDVYHLHQLCEALSAPRLEGLILDGGCGEGIDFATLALDSACEVVGVELSAGGIAASRARARRLRTAHLVQGDLLKLPLASDLFDAAYSYGVVHHTPDPERAVRELARVLKPSAPLLLYVYEDFSDRPFYWRLALALVNSARVASTRCPPAMLMFLCRVLSPAVWLLCTVPGRRFRWAARFPYRHGTSPSSLSGDLYDRFGAPIERRYSESGARALVEQAGLTVRQTAQRRGWMVWAEKK
jgi:SAM-dependent methyltransferase